MGRCSEWESLIVHIADGAPLIDEAPSEKSENYRMFFSTMDFV